MMKNGDIKTMGSLGIGLSVKNQCKASLEFSLAYDAITSFQQQKRSE
jgi:hypothetical protein